MNVVESDLWSIDATLYSELLVTWLAQEDRLRLPLAFCYRLFLHVFGLFLALVASKSWPLLGPSWSACSMRASPGSDLSAPDLDHPQIVVGSQSISSRQRTRDFANTPAFARSKHQRRKIEALSSAKWSRTRLTNSLRQAIRARQDRIGTSEPIRWPPAGCRATPARTANVKLRYEPHRRENRS